MKSLRLFLAAQCLLLAAALGGGRVLFILGEEEYGLEASLRKFGAGALAEAGFESAFVAAASAEQEGTERNHFPDLGAELAKADVLVVATWRRFPSVEEAAQFQKWVADGQPVLGLRTASHAFSARKGWQIPAGHASWEEFDRDVFGADYIGHYRKQKEKAVQSLIWSTEAAKKSPLMKGLKFRTPFEVESALYQMVDLDEDAIVVLRGIVSGLPCDAQPVTWSLEKEGRKSVFTTLGGTSDFTQNPWLETMLTNSVRWLAE